MGVESRLWIANTFLLVCATLSAQVVGPGQDLNKVDYNELVKQGTAKDFSYLISQGITFHVPFGTGATWLMTVVDRNNPDTGIASVLVKEGTNPNAIDTYNNTALRLAIRNMNVAWIDALIANGADPNLEDAKKEVPLGYALSLSYQAVNGQSRSVGEQRSPELTLQALIRDGANVNREVAPGLPRVFLLTNLPYFDDLVPLLVQKGLNLRVNMSFKDIGNPDESLLMSYLKHPKATPATVRLLVDHGSDVNHVDGLGYSALVNAVLFVEDPNVALELLNGGADPNVGLFDKMKAIDIARGIPAFKGTEAMEKLEKFSNRSAYEDWLESISPKSKGHIISTVQGNYKFPEIPNDEN